MGIEIKKNYTSYEVSLGDEYELILQYEDYRLTYKESLEWLIEDIKDVSLVDCDYYYEDKLTVEILGDSPNSVVQEVLKVIKQREEEARAEYEDKDKQKLVLDYLETNEYLSELDRSNAQSGELEYSDFFARLNDAEAWDKEGRPSQEPDW